MDESGQLGPSDEASVVLDIGGDVGALIITTEPDLHLVEIELSRADGTHPLPEDAPERRSAVHAHGHDHGAEPHTHEAVPHTHVAVRQRRGTDGSRFAAIYPALREGAYVIHRPDGSDEQVDVVGGQVTEVSWVNP